MPDHDLPSQLPAVRERYEAPRIVEDLPLESFSLVCDPGKADDACLAVFGVTST